jgi:nicotinamide mononucleotide transporter
MDSLLSLTQPWLSPAFSIWGSPVTWLEIVAFWLSVAMVVCNIRVNALGWPLAIISSLLYARLFLDARMYGETGLQFVFVGLAVWGWWQWLRGHSADGSTLRVSSLGIAARGRLLMTMAVLWPTLGWLLARHTDSDVPWWDAFPTAGSLIGQWLLGRKYTDNWPVWIGVNLVSVALFAYKGLWLTALLYGLFAVMAWAGWRAWLEIETRSASPSPA